MFSDTAQKRKVGRVRGMNKMLSHAFSSSMYPHEANGSNKY